MNEMTHVSSSIPKARGKFPQYGSSASESDASASSSSSFCDEIGIISRGMIFRDKEAMKRAVRMFSMKVGFKFQTEKSDSSQYILHCIDKSCSWMLRATFSVGSTSFVVKTYISEHTCDSSLQNVNHRQSSARTLGSMVSNHFEPVKQL